MFRQMSAALTSVLRVRNESHDRDEEITEESVGVHNNYYCRRMEILKDCPLFYNVDLIHSDHLLNIYLYI